MSLHSGELCRAPESGATPASSQPEESGPRLCEPPRSQGDEQHVEYVAFTSESGSVSKMAVVRRRLARVLGRYLLGEPIAAGGMATVHLGRLLGPAGFSRTVAVKRLHAHLATNPEFVQRFVDEARIASRVRHANVVQTLDVVAVADELLLVLDYVHGESFARLRRLATAANAPIPPSVAAGIVIGVLRGLHAAHEAKSAKGTPLELVHRDVSPQNIIVGADGVARVLDFGIAKAAGRVHETLNNGILGKLAYMPPEQVAGEELDRRADLFAVGVVLWEALAGERLFRGEDAMSTMDAIYKRDPPRLSDRDLGIEGRVDDVLARALAKDASDRFDTADAMARALEAALPPANDREIAEWVERMAGELLHERLERVAAFEGDDTGGSKARLFAAEARDAPASRRDALMPPPLPLDSVTNESTTLRGPAASLPTLEIDASSLMPLPAASPPRTQDLPPGSVAVEGVSEQRPMVTPFVMISPAEVASKLPESGQTRFGPIEHRASRVRTPIPMPMPLAVKAKRRATAFQLALLVILPPFVVLVALSGAKLGRGAASGAAQDMRATATVSAPPAVAVAESAMVAPPVSAPPAEVAEAADAGLAMPAAGMSKSDPKTDAKSEKKGVRPVHRPPRLARPLPSPVNR